MYVYVYFYVYAYVYVYVYAYVYVCVYVCVYVYVCMYIYIYICKYIYIYLYNPRVGTEAALQGPEFVTTKGRRSKEHASLSLRKSENPIHTMDSRVFMGYPQWPFQ